MKKVSRSPLALAVLALLIEKPMHPYQIQQEIKRRGQDKVINVGQRASLYKTIDRLARDGLIVVREVSRDSSRPERTVYEPTTEAYELARGWTRKMLSTPRADFPEFPAGLAFLGLLTQEDAQEHLELRQAWLTRELEDRRAEAAAAPAELPRLLLLEGEYLQAMLSTELEWIMSVLKDMRDGEVTWTRELLTEFSKRFSPVN